MALSREIAILLTKFVIAVGWYNFCIYINGFGQLGTYREIPNMSYRHFKHILGGLYSGRFIVGDLYLECNLR